MKGKSQVNILLVNDKRVPGEGNHYCAEALSRRNKDTSLGRLSTKHLNQSSELIPADGSPSKGDFTRTQAPKYPSRQLFHWVSAGLGPHSLAKMLSLFLFLSVYLSVSPSLCFSFSVALFLSVSLSLCLILSLSLPYLNTHTHTQACARARTHTHSHTHSDTHRE